jgi:hypothetical protein
MGKAQEAFFQALRRAPYHAVAKRIAAKLADKGVHLRPHDLERLIEFLQTETDDVFRIRTWRWWENREVAITLTEDEAREIEHQLLRKMDGGLNALIRSIVEEVSGDVLKSLHATWRSHARSQTRDLTSFKKGMRTRWGNAIDRLRMSLTVARDLGSSANTCLRKDPEEPLGRLGDVLTRLHARACQITDEVTCLLAGGFADGAIARWRTLHEIAVVASFLRESGEQLARRYTEHEIIESYRAATEYQQCSERLGFERMSDEEYEEITQARERLLQSYGSEFDSPYGWAAEALGNKRPTLRHIEEAAGMDHLRAHYRMASHNIHANSKGAFFRLGIVREARLLLAGPSDAGLGEPGQSSAISLMQVTAAVSLLRTDLDAIIGLTVLSRLTEETIALFQEAQEGVASRAAR